MTTYRTAGGTYEVSSAKDLHLVRVHGERARAKARESHEPAPGYKFLTVQEGTDSDTYVFAREGSYVFTPSGELLSAGTKKATTKAAKKAAKKSGAKKR